LLDPDFISPTNRVRQPFSQSEIGLYESVVLANRLNLFWGLDWQDSRSASPPNERWAAWILSSGASTLVWREPPSQSARRIGVKWIIGWTWATTQEMAQVFRKCSL
jgi:hypothetical protein